LICPEVKFYEDRSTFHSDNAAKPSKPEVFALSAPVLMCCRVAGRVRVHDDRLHCYEHPNSSSPREYGGKPLLLVLLQIREYPFLPLPFNREKAPSIMVSARY